MNKRVIRLGMIVCVLFVPSCGNVLPNNRLDTSVKEPLALTVQESADKQNKLKQIEEAKLIEQLTKITSEGKVVATADLEVDFYHHATSKGFGD